MKSDNSYWVSISTLSSKVDKPPFGKSAEKQRRKATGAKSPYDDMPASCPYWKQAEAAEKYIGGLIFYEGEIEQF